MGNEALAGKVAVVTGAASGIGRAIAESLAAEGAAVCVADLNARGAQEAADALRRAGRRAHALPVDVAEPASVRSMIEETVAVCGRLDVLVNNAGLQHIAPIVEYPEAQWERLIRVMLTGTFLCTKYVLPHMIPRKWGRVVNVASAHGLVASPFKSAYVAAKHGIVGFTKVAAWEVAEHGITVNAVCPGYVRTPLVEGRSPTRRACMGFPRPR